MQQKKDNGLVTMCTMRVLMYENVRRNMFSRVDEILMKFSSDLIEISFSH